MPSSTFLPPFRRNLNYSYLSILCFDILSIVQFYSPGSIAIFNLIQQRIGSGTTNFNYRCSFTKRIRSFVVNLASYRYVRVDLTMSRRMTYVSHGFQLYNNRFNNFGDLSCCYTVPETKTDGRQTTIALHIPISDFLAIRDSLIWPFNASQASEKIESVESFDDLLFRAWERYHVYQIIAHSFARTSLLSGSSSSASLALSGEEMAREPSIDLLTEIK